MAAKKAKTDIYTVTVGNFGIGGGNGGNGASGTVTVWEHY